MFRSTSPLTHLIAGALLLSALSAIFVPGAEAATSGTQTWTFTDAGSAVGDYKMNREGLPAGSPVPIAQNASRIWAADESARSDLAFADGVRTFNVSLQVREGQTLRVNVGYVANGHYTSCTRSTDLFINVVNSVGNITATQDEQLATTATYSFTPAACAIPAGATLAVNVTALGGQARIAFQPVTQIVGPDVGPSTLTVSSTPPAYPGVFSVLGSPASGNSGIPARVDSSVITVTGTGLTFATKVEFVNTTSGQRTPATFSHVDDGHLSVTVPAGLRAWTYQICVTAGSVQCSPQIFTVLPISPGTSPTDLTIVTGPYVGQATLSWGRPVDDGNSPITGYTISASRVGASLLSAATYSTTGTTETLTLEPCATYSFGVSGVNAGGAGPAATGSQLTGHTADLPAAPTGLGALTGAPAGQTLVSWTAPAVPDGACPVTGYQLLRDVHADMSSAAARALGADTSAVDGGLAPRTLYFYRVAAVSLVGTGPASDQVEVLSSYFSNSQTWLPEYDGSLTSFGHKGTHEGLAGAEPLQVPDGGSFTWLADETAVVDVAFGSNDWTYNLDLARAFVGTATLEVGSTHQGVYTPIGSVVLHGNGARMYSGSIPVTSAFTVVKGDTLTFRLINTPDATGGINRQMMVNTGTDTTRFVSPTSDPGYPTPELTTLTLTTLGFVGAVLVARRTRP